MSTTKEVFDRHREAFGNSDMEGVLADYATDAVVITRDEVYRGPDEIRELFEELFHVFAEVEHFAIHEEVIEEEIAYFTWEAVTAEATIEFGTDTFVIRDGEKVYQTVSAYSP